MLGVTFDQAWLPMLLACLLPVWFLGTLTGMMLPRPKWLSNPSMVSSTFLNLGGFKHIALLIHGVLILRECWYRVFEAGTFRLFMKSVWLWFCGQGWEFDFPHAKDPSPKPDALERDAAQWYVSESDLDTFKKHSEASGWESMMEKNIPGLIKYQALRRTLPSGKTEYKSVSISPDATAEEFMDFYLDDDARPLWDTMITEHEVVENGHFANREMVVRWIRKFPFKFISDREYVIARKVFREDDDTLYSVTKAVNHPLVKKNPKVVSMDVFHSMWRCRNVPCPWGSGKPACETTLLHHELFKIPENLARFAAKAGMWTFVHKMAQEVAPFVQARRERVEPFCIDSKAYGHSGGLETHSKTAPSGKGLRRRSLSLPSLSTQDDTLPDPPHLSKSPSQRRVTESNMVMRPITELNVDSHDDEDDDEDEVDEDESSEIVARSSKSSMKGLATLAVAGGLAIMMRRSGSAALLSASELASKQATKSKFPKNRYRRSTSEFF